MIVCTTTLEHLGLYAFRAYTTKEDIGTVCTADQAATKETCPSETTSGTTFE